MTRVAIVGSGMIGRAWAITCARVGHQVALWDAAAEEMPRPAARHGIVPLRLPGTFWEAPSGIAYRQA